MRRAGGLTASCSELEFQTGKEDPRVHAESRRVRIKRNKMHRAEMKFRKRFE